MVTEKITTGKVTSKKYDYKKDVRSRNAPAYQHDYGRQGWQLVDIFRTWEDADKWIAIKGNRRTHEYREVPLDKKGSQISLSKMAYMQKRNQNPAEIKLYTRLK